MATVRLEGVSKSYGDIQAVKNVSLEIKHGEFLVLLGPTGAGKTTTLRTVAGLEQPESGKIYFDEICINNLTPAERDVAFVFQNRALYPRYTVFDNIASPLKARNVERAVIEHKVKEVTEILQIAHLLERKPGQLSGGEMQRVALGRAMVREPNLFLLDEPFSDLDAKLRENMRTELKRLQSDFGATFFYATPDQAEALSMADRIVVLRGGEILQVGTPDQIYSQPANIFVADFVGSPGMNFVPCVFMMIDEQVYLDVGPSLFEIELLDEHRESMKNYADGQKLTFGVRAEDIVISGEPKHNWIEAQVYVIETLGANNIVDVEIGKYILKVKTEPNFEPQIGEKVWINFKRNKLHVFDENDFAIF